MYIQYVHMYVCMNRVLTVHHLTVRTYIVCAPFTMVVLLHLCQCQTVCPALHTADSAATAPSSGTCMAAWMTEHNKGTYIHTHTQTSQVGT